MNKERIKEFIAKLPLTVVEAMAKIDGHASDAGLVFILDEAERLIGCVADGDIRRWILSGGDLYASTENVMHKTPIYLSKSEKNNAKAVMLEESITAVPIVDGDNKVIDIVLSREVSKIKNRKKSLKGVPVVIMAGDKGTRLYPFTKILPKPLISIGDTPIVERIIDYYVEYGLGNIIIYGYVAIVLGVLREDSQLSI